MEDLKFLNQAKLQPDKSIKVKKTQLLCQDSTTQGKKYFIFFVMVIYFLQLITIAFFCRFLCTYRLQWYPFDIQNCKLIFKMKGKSGDFAELGKLTLHILLI